MNTDLESKGRRKRQFVFREGTGKLKLLKQLQKEKDFKFSRHKYQHSLRKWVIY
jgi:hypothetical protein